MRDLMVRLARPMLRLLGRDERGAVGVLVAILIGGGVLLGFGAMVIDAGQLYQNRAELQNGADAAALAVAKSCAAGACQSSIAANYAMLNASKLTSGNAGVDLVCGSGSLPLCPVPINTITDCPAPPAGGVNYVDVHTSTRTPTGTLLPPVFAQTLLGNSGYVGTNVKACAQASWGPPASGDTIAYTISACSWYVYTSNGTAFAQPPPYPPNTPPAPSYDHIMFEHGSQGSTATGCPPYQPSGQDAPGNFGWTNDLLGNCSTFISTSGTYTGSTGASASGDCKTVISNAYTNKTVVYLPVYSSITGTGSNVTYTLLGFAAFVITGYHITGSFKANDWLNPANNCTGNNFCIDGYFTHGLIPSTGLPGGQNLGASIISLTG
jgi:hypothetical protein